MNFEFSDAIALLALALSAFSVVKTIQFNERQKKFINTYDELNKALLRKERNEAMSEMTADLYADFIKQSQTKWHLSIGNKGKGAARNVRIELPEGQKLISGDELKKFPLEILEKGESIQLAFWIHLQSPEKLDVKLIWDDRRQWDNEKTFILYR